MTHLSGARHKAQDIYVVNAFAERRSAVERELTVNGKAAPEAIHRIAAPRGEEVRGRGLAACRRWRDPHAERLLTWGEAACFAGHLEAWRRIAAAPSDSASGAIVVEDDARVTAPLDAFPKRGDLVYLGGKFLEEAGAPAVDGLLPAPYVYWTVGYWLSRAAAIRLVEAVRVDNIIPVDEFLPYHYGRNANVGAQEGRALGQAESLGLTAWALPEWIVEPCGRWPSGSEQSPPAFDLDTYVFATDRALAAEALDAYRAHGYRPQTLGEGEPGWDTSGVGGIEKLRWLKRALAAKDAAQLRRSVVLAVDGYDTLPAVDAANLLERFGAMQADLVIGGERACWPDPALAADFDRLRAERPADGPYRYPCSGTVIGFAPELLAALDDVEDERHRDDQLYLQQRMLAAARERAPTRDAPTGERAPARDAPTGDTCRGVPCGRPSCAVLRQPEGDTAPTRDVPTGDTAVCGHDCRGVPCGRPSCAVLRQPEGDTAPARDVPTGDTAVCGHDCRGVPCGRPSCWRIDDEAYLFQAINGAEQDIARREGRPFNRMTNCYPAIVHANGPADIDPARPLPYREPQLDADAGQWMEVAEGIIAMPLLPAQARADLLRAAAAAPGLWRPLEGDNVPGDELRIELLDTALWDGLRTALREHLAPVVDARWRPSAWKDPCDAFLIRYSADKQPSIRLHEDISYFSCSLRLKKACAGGELLFPRQNFCDALIPDGWLLCWPSRITHPHQVLPVKKGKRVSLVVWTPER